MIENLRNQVAFPTRSSWAYTPEFVAVSETEDYVMRCFSRRTEWAFSILTSLRLALSTELMYVGMYAIKILIIQNSVK